MSRFFIWIVTGTSTVSLVTFTKSARTSKGMGFRMTFDVTTSSSRSLNFTGGGACNFANCIRRSNSLVCRSELIGPSPNRSIPPLKREALLAIPICSYNVSPAFGV
jgi:hypothetical protein